MAIAQIPSVAALKELLRTLDKQNNKRRRRRRWAKRELGSLKRLSFWLVLTLLPASEDRSETRGADQAKKVVWSNM